MPEVCDGIRARLFLLADPAYRAFQQPLIPTVLPERVIGVRTPALRALARELAGTSAAETFRADLPHRYFEENQLHAFLIEKHHESQMPHLRQGDRILLRQSLASLLLGTLQAH